jgi:hypothetical protein
MAVPPPKDPSVTQRVRLWLAAWGPILPLLIAEGTIWVGFGALLPILPIYFTEHGVDLPTLAWWSPRGPLHGCSASPVRLGG